MSVTRAQSSHWEADSSPLCSSPSLIKACRDPGCGRGGVSVALGQAAISPSSLGPSQFSKARTELQSWGDHRTGEGQKDQERTHMH